MEVELEVEVEMKRNVESLPPPLGLVRRSAD